MLGSSVGGLLSEWRAFVEALQLPGLLGFLLTFSHLLPAVLALLQRAGSPVAPVGNALTRMTLSPNALVGGVKGNVIPGVCTVSAVILIMLVFCGLFRFGRVLV